MPFVEDEEKKEITTALYLKSGKTAVMYRNKQRYIQKRIKNFLSFYQNAQLNKNPMGTIEEEEKMGQIFKTSLINLLAF